MAERVLARLTLPAETASLAPTGALVRSVGEIAGLPPREVDHLESAIDEACTNVIQHAFAPGEAGTYDVVLARRPGQLVAAVEDRGLPFDQGAVAHGRGAGLGLALMRAFAREVRLVNLGSQGKRTELVFDLPSSQMDAVRAEGPEATGAEAPISAEPVAIRLLRPEEAPLLARCVYRTYGYSYVNEALYRPEQVRERMEAGLAESLVAATPAGELVAHLALLKEHSGARTAESGQAVVAPAFRGRRLFEQMKARLVEHARSRGLLGLTSEAVTIHPATQKGNQVLGAVETGLLLGYIPGRILFGKDQDTSLRQSAMLYFLPLNPIPLRPAFVPEAHRDLAGAICDRLRLARSFQDGGVAAEAAATDLELQVRPDWGQAYLRLRAFGPDTVAAVHGRLTELRRQRLDCIYLDLPLARPGTRIFGPALEALGFGFAGLLPEGAPDGDVLRLQCLNNVDLAPERIVAFTDFGRRIKAYALDAQARLPG